jgi:hypothetical protein
LATPARHPGCQQQEVIESLRTENQILKEKLGKRQILLTDDQRRRLAAKGKVLGRKVLETTGTLFTPDTLRWHRLLVAQKWDFSDRARVVSEESASAGPRAARNIEPEVAWPRWLLRDYREQSSAEQSASRGDAHLAEVAEPGFVGR